MTGVLGPGTNAHGPNEFLPIEMTKNVISSMAYVLAKSYGKNWKLIISFSFVYDFNIYGNNFLSGK